MNFTNYLRKTKDFIIRRVTELFGLIVIFIALSLLVSLLSYSPSDPNFIINQNHEVKNLLGFRGSIISDFLFQSIGLISFLIPLTLLFSGTNILISKKQIIFIDNIFFCILYILFGCLFLSYFKWQWWFCWDFS